MIVKTPGSQMGSPAAAEEGGEEVGGWRWESGERSEVQARSTLTSTAPDVGGWGRYPPVLHFFSLEPIFWFDLYQIHYRYHALIKRKLMKCNTGTLDQ